MNGKGFSIDFFGPPIKHVYKRKHKEVNNKELEDLIMNKLSGDSSVTSKIPENKKLAVDEVSAKQTSNNN